MKYIIKIPNPCDENWGKMTPTERGMFCSNCKKELIDYRHYSNKQLLQSLNGNEKICGRFSLHQIDKELKSSETNCYHRFGLLLGFSSLFLATPVFSQNEKSKTEITENKSDDELTPKSSNEFVEFYGKIIEKPISENDTINALPGVFILQKDTENSVTSNIDGDFVIKVPVDDFKGKVVLVFSYIAAETREIEVFKTKRDLKIEMIFEESTMGAVVIVKSKRNIFTRIGNLFR